MRKAFKIIKLNQKSPNYYFNNIAKIHKNEIDSGFLSTFGIQFLCRLYKSIASSKYSFVFAAIYEDELIGFICGSTNTKMVYLYFILNNGFAIIPVLLKKFMKPKWIWRILETFVYPNRKDIVALPKSEILNFCVRNKFQGKGVGQQLFQFMIDEFHNRNINNFKIITGATQIKAQRFYHQMGARLVSGIEVHRGIQSLLYVYRCIN
ncbi:MAG: GNAT family N-acetyltransferase [bacterium]